MNRFLLKDIKFENIIKVSDNELIFQLQKVLRLWVWDKIIFFNWSSYIDYVYEITEINKKYLVFIFIKDIKKESELSFDLVLYQSLPNKLSKLEYIIQKASEVWFRKIIFFRAERSQKLNLTDNKKDRLLKIMIEAIEQSWRNKILELDFIDAIENYKIDWENIILHPWKNKESVFLKNLDINYKNNINIFIWPEWGFSEDEIESFNKNLNIKKIFLWNRILRTETAGIVVWFFISQKLLK